MVPRTGLGSVCVEYCAVAGVQASPLQNIQLTEAKHTYVWRILGVGDISLSSVEPPRHHNLGSRDTRLSGRSTGPPTARGTHGRPRNDAMRGRGCFVRLWTAICLMTAFEFVDGLASTSMHSGSKILTQRGKRFAATLY